MLEVSNLKHTLEATVVALRAVRKAIAAAGQIESMHEIDTLLHIAQVEAERKLATMLITGFSQHPR